MLVINVNVASQLPLWVSSCYCRVIILYIHTITNVWLRPPGSISSCDAFLNVFQTKGLRSEVICPCASSTEGLTNEPPPPHCWRPPPAPPPPLRPPRRHCWSSPPSPPSARSWAPPAAAGTPAPRPVLQGDTHARRFHSSPQRKGGLNTMGSRDGNPGNSAYVTTTKCGICCPVFLFGFLSRPGLRRPPSWALKHSGWVCG